MAIDMWIAAMVGEVTVLFNVENEASVSWLKEVQGRGGTREEAIKDLERRLSHEKEI
jgi:hypothetical protein